MRLILIAFCSAGLFIGCAHKPNNDRKNFPKHWWKPVAKKELKWWEISPESAKAGEVVLSKRNELGILSNFANSPFTYEGVRYPGVEGLWQSMKFPEGKNDPRRVGTKWKYTRAQVAQMVGHKAKKAGGIGSKNMGKLGINYVTFNGKQMTYHTDKKGEHYDLIRALLIEKYKQNVKVQKVLLSTGDLILKPDHKVGKSSPPAWRYYQLWMEIRELARKGKL